MNDGFKRLCDLIGEHHAFRLISICGGTRIYIPTVEHCKEQHYLAQAIGLDNLIILAREFGSDRIEVPIGQAELKKMRNQEIIAMFREGGNQSTLALRFGMTERQIRTIISRRPPVIDTNQLPLFT